jgi:hypothetical protein
MSLIRAGKSQSKTEFVELIFVELIDDNFYRTKKEFFYEQD